MMDISLDSPSAPPHIGPATVSRLVAAAEAAIASGGNLESVIRVLLQFDHCYRAHVLAAARHCRDHSPTTDNSAHWHTVASTLERAATTGLF